MLGIQVSRSKRSNFGVWRPVRQLNEGLEQEAGGSQAKMRQRSTSLYAWLVIKSVHFPPSVWALGSPLAEVTTEGRFLQLGLSGG